MAKDIYHDLVRTALENEGWTVTHDPYFLRVGFGRRSVAADFGAEKVIIAEKETRKILVLFLSRHQVNLIVFDTEKPVILLWKK